MAGFLALPAAALLGVIAVPSSMYSLVLAGLFLNSLGSWVMKRALCTESVGIADVAGAVAIILLE